MSKPYYRQRKAPNRHPWRTDCKSRKIRYSSAEEALTAAILRPDHPGEMVATKPYQCRDCGGYHLTKAET